MSSTICGDCLENEHCKGKYEQCKCNCSASSVLESKEELDLKSKLINALRVFDLSSDDFKYDSNKSNLDDFWRAAKKAIDSYHQQQLEQAVREAIPKTDLQKELQQAAIEMSELPLSELTESEKWEFYGYLRALRDIAYFAKVLSITDIQKRLEERLAELLSTKEDKSNE